MMHIKIATHISLERFSIMPLPCRAQAGVLLVVLLATAHGCQNALMTDSRRVVLIVSLVATIGLALVLGVTDRPRPCSTRPNFSCGIWCWHVSRCSLRPVSPWYAGGSG